jgi:hypothetical protein
MAGVLYPVRLESIEAYVRAVNGGPRELVRSERDIIDEYAQQIVGDIEDAWPVDTSTSRDAWAYTVTARADWMGFTIENDVDYVEYVHYAGTDPEPLWETLIPTTVRAYAPQLLADLRAEIAVTQRRIAEDKRQGGRGYLDVLQRLYRTTGRATA